MKVKQNNRSLFIGILIWYIVALFFVSLTTTWGQSSLTATCIDTIAGYSALCKSSDTAPNTEVQFDITKPDGKTISIPCISDEEGKAICDLNGLHTQKAGLYRIEAYLGGYDKPDNLNQTGFIVYPDAVSPDRSECTASPKTIPANGTTASLITVTIRDKYGNPIPQQYIEILSSSVYDDITPVKQSLTDENGQVKFKLTTTHSAVSTLIARVKNSNITLRDRPTIVSHGGATSTTSFTSNPNTSYKTSLLDSTSIGGGVVSKLKLTAPDTVVVNTPFDITVEALDSNGEPANGYRGWIFFSSDDDMASLPLRDEGYKFTGTDKNASHTFYKSTTFVTIGQKKLSVTDLDDPTLTDDVYITVTRSGGTNQNVNAPETEATIISPSSSTILGNSDIPISGTIKSNTTYKMLDQGIEIGEDKSDSEGNFIFEAKGLEDGKHTFKVVMMDENGNETGSSNEVIVFIDTKCPTFTDISFDPSTNLTINMPITVTVKAESKLSRVRVTVDNVPHDLTEEEDSPGTYTGKFQTPSKEGEYPIKLTLRGLGQDCNPSANKKLVLAKKAEPEEIKGLKAETGKTSGTVDLTWTQPDDLSSFKKYVIRYDTSPLELNEKVASTSKEASFTVENLKPKTTYYFAVSMVNDNDQEGPQSDIIPGTTKGADEIENLKAVSEDGRIVFTWDDPENLKIVHYKFDYGIHSGEYLESAYTKDNRSTWYIPDLINGISYYFVLHALDENDTILLDSEEISAVPGGERYHRAACTAQDVQNLRILKRGDQRVMTWDALPGVGTYRIYSGTQQGVFNLPPREVKENYFVIPYLSTNVPYYYFAVKAVCTDNTESLNFSNILKVDTGPWSLVIVGISLVVVAAVRRLSRKQKGT